MKFILILFVCINDPFAPIESTCVMQPLKMTFDSMKECRLGAQYIYEDIKDPNVHMTSFCAQKNLTSI
jgi:hypothetical protein